MKCYKSSPVWPGQGHGGVGWLPSRIRRPALLYCYFIFLFYLFVTRISVVKMDKLKEKLKKGLKLGGSDLIPGKSKAFKGTGHKLGTVEPKVKIIQIS